MINITNKIEIVFIVPGCIKCLPGLESVWFNFYSYSDYDKIHLGSNCIFTRKPIGFSRCVRAIIMSKGKIMDETVNVPI